MGTLSTLCFGFSHNITGTDAGFSVNTLRFNMRTIPTPQIIGGGVLWALQRKFGFFSNLTAHAFYNNSVT